MNRKIASKILSKKLIISLLFLVGALAGCGESDPAGVDETQEKGGSVGTQEADALAGSAGTTVQNGSAGSSAAGEQGNAGTSGEAGQTNENDAGVGSTGGASGSEIDGGTTDTQADGGTKEASTSPDADPPSCSRPLTSYETPAVPVDGVPGVWACPAGVSGIVIEFTCCTGCVVYIGSTMRCGSGTTDDACGGASSAAWTKRSSPSLGAGFRPSTAQSRL